jgi:hypothetical protein
VRSEDASRGAGDDELAGAVWSSVYDPAVEVCVGYDRDGAVFVAVLVAGLTLGEADAAVFGVGETAVRDDGVPVGAVLAEHGVLGGEGALVVGALDEHHPPGQISRGEDVRGARPEAVVHRHVAASCLYASGGQVQRVHVAGPADREHHRLRL